jgi:hypothetical protein
MYWDSPESQRKLGIQMFLSEYISNNCSLLHPSIVCLL